jgi:tetratricopeptide (TPR) repeat protein
MSADDFSAAGPECPGRDTLRAFDLGELPKKKWDQVAAHLQVCARCLAAVEGRRIDTGSLTRELGQTLPSGAVPGTAQPSPEQTALTPPTVEGRDAPPPIPGQAAGPARLAPSSRNRYAPLRFHARGGLGEVHVARDRELDRDVAFKVIRPDQAGDADSRRRLVQEAEITGKLEHPGVVPVYGLVQGEGGEPCYAMRFIQGESLKDAIKSFHQADRPGRDPGERSLALRQLRSRFVAVCDTLAYAHSRGVLHRDLKPDNILLGRYGETLVVDWGLAKLFDHTEAERATGEESLAPGPGPDDGGTQTGQALGTPAYMSPEQAAGEWARVGPASDLFSLGATLYALLTGRPPYPDRSLPEVLARARRGDFPPPRQVKRGVSASLEAVCLKAMALRPEERYGSAQDLKAEVERFLADEPVRAYREPWTTGARRWVKRHPAWAAAVPAILFLGGVVALWVVAERAERRRATEQRMNTALSRAEQLRDQAARMQPEAAVVVWKQALAAAEQADGMRATGRAGEEMSRRAARLLVELRQEVERARKEVRLLTALEEARLARSVMRGEYFDFAASAQGYVQAFFNYQLDVLGQNPVTAGRALRRLPDPIRRALVVALDDWAHGAPGNVAQHLRKVADRADDDPWRRRVRRARSLAALKLLALEAQRGLVTDGRRKRRSAVSLDLLALGLVRAGARAEAIALLGAAQGRYPGDFWINLDLGTLFCPSDQGSRKGPGQAVGYLRAAVAIRPHCASAHNNLGNALQARGDVAGAIAAYRQAIVLNPSDAGTHSNLGTALVAAGDVAGAITAYRKALAIRPQFAEAHCNLGFALRQQGSLTASLASLRRGHELGTRQTTWRHPSAQWVRQAERLVQLEQQLPAFRQGKPTPRDPGECLQLAEVCLYTKRFATAVGFYRAAFATDGQLEAPRRYNAACCAALAAAGRAEDAADLKSEQKADLRPQALAWLRADLDRWRKHLDQGTPQARHAVQQELRHWQHDPDLAGLREDTALSRLSEAERGTWKKFWSDVARLLQRAGAPRSSPRGKN